MRIWDVRTHVESCSMAHAWPTHQTFVMVEVVIRLSCVGMQQRCTSEQAALRRGNYVLSREASVCALPLRIGMAAPPNRTSNSRPHQSSVANWLCKLKGGVNLPAKAICNGEVRKTVARCTPLQCYTVNQLLRVWTNLQSGS